jgi:Tol biopolymer transport system component
MRSQSQRRIALGVMALAGALLACGDSMSPPPPGNGHYDCIPGNNPFDYPMHHQHPSWSTRGPIAFEDLGIVFVDSSGVYNNDSSLTGLWVIDPTSRNRHRVVSFGRTPTWSPDGTTIMFSIGQLFTVKVDGSQLTQITFSGAHHFPSWSPTGTWITFDDVQDVWVMREDGSEPRNIGDVSGPQGSRMPSWSPDGSKIVHIRYVSAPFPTASAEIFIMDASGANVVRLTSNETDDRHPVYSPDAEQIAYSGQFLDGTTPDDLLPQIWVVRANGSGARQLTAHGGYHPSWSSDGASIVYTRENAICNIPENGVLWTVDLRTGTETQLTTKWPEPSP